MESPTKLVRMSRTQKLVFMAMMVAMALVLSYFERMIPISFTIPGAKLGLANVVTLSCLYLLTFKETFLVVVIRILLGAIFVSSMSSFFYSLAGGILSFLVMYLMMAIKKDLFSTMIVSVAGGVTHNLGQILIAAMVINNVNIIYFVPNLFVIGIATGLGIGFTVNYLLKYLKKILA